MVSYMRHIFFCLPQELRITLDKEREKIMILCSQLAEATSQQPSKKSSRISIPSRIVESERITSGLAKDNSTTSKPVEDLQVKEYSLYLYVYYLHLPSQSHTSSTCVCYAKVKHGLPHEFKNLFSLSCEIDLLSETNISLILLYYYWNLIMKLHLFMQV